jgi:hypothetical protein
MHLSKELWPQIMCDQVWPQLLVQPLLSSPYLLGISPAFLALSPPASHSGSCG